MLPSLIQYVFMFVCVICHLVILALVTHMFQVYSERERLSSVPALGCAPQRHAARLWWQHAQRHVTQ